MVKARFDLFSTESNDEAELKEIEEEFWKHHKDYQKIRTALEFMDKYDKANPEVQSAIQTLLKVHSQDS